MATNSAIDATHMAGDGHESLGFFMMPPVLMSRLTPQPGNRVEGALV